MSQTSPFASKDTGGQYNKVDVIIGAYSKLRISGLTVQATPEDLELALDTLEMMASEFENNNICTGYNFEDEPDPNSPMNVIRSYKNAFVTNLAIRVSPDFNKEIHQVLFMQASQSLSNMAGQSAMERISQVSYPNRMPRGSGSTLRYNRWSRFYRDVGTVNSCATEQLFIGDINNYTEHYEAYLNDGETIASFTIVSDPAIDILSSSNTDTDITYQVEATSAFDGNNQSGGIVTIVMTTSSARVETRQTLFNFAPRNNPQG